MARPSVGEDVTSEPRRPQVRWEGVIEVCKTCDRKAQWPFCEHREQPAPDGSDRWYRLVCVREVGR
ncbi:MAG: hypothetical protein JWO69_2031 [Thermoleophilia bacterium]|nr:hypothetical protein [Thermoleophilia bacterium]